MAIFAGQNQGRAWRRYVAELPFIPVVSDWLELLASLLAQPCMFVSSLYIIAETVIPGLAAWSVLLDSTTKAVMSLAPEIVLPGCFQQAQQSRRDGKENKARLLFALCALFGLLTLVTFASFLWHFGDAIASFILFVRCASGVSYTIILKIDKEQQRAIVIPPSAQPTVDLTAQISQIVRSEIQAAMIAQSHSAATTTVQVINAQNVAQTSQTAHVAAPTVAQAKSRIAQRPTPAQTPAIAQRSVARNEEAVAHTEPVLPVVTVTPVVAQGEDKRARVRDFIKRYQGEHGGTIPTQKEIEETCKVAKNTANKYRGEYRKELELEAAQ